MSVNNVNIEGVMPEKPKLPAYRGDQTRKNIGRYFIIEDVQKKIATSPTLGTFFGDEVAENQQEDGLNKNAVVRPTRFLGIFRRKAEIKESDKLRKIVEEDKEVQFVKKVQKYHASVSKEGFGKPDQYVDSLSIGILYKLSESGEIINKLKSEGQTVSIDRGQNLNFPGLMETEEYKIALKNSLLALGESSLLRMGNQKGDTTEIDFFAGYIRQKTGGDAQALSDLPRSNREWIELYTQLLEEKPQFLQDYFINYRFIEEVDKSRDIFKLGESTASYVIEHNKPLREKEEEIAVFSNYRDRERNFAEDENFWGEKIDKNLSHPIVKKILGEAIHMAKTDSHRAEDALVDEGVLRVRKDGALIAQTEFIEMFGSLFSKDPAKNEQDILTLGVIYGLKDELGVGISPRDQVMDNVEVMYRSLRNIGREQLTKYVVTNFDNFAEEFYRYAATGEFGVQLKARVKNAGSYKEYKKIFLTALKDKKSPLLLNLINLKYVDSFTFGRIVGESIKAPAEEKKIADQSEVDEFKNQVREEEAAFNFLSKGEKITDPEIRERVESSLRKTSKLNRFIEKCANRAGAITKVRGWFQSRLFYTEGESPFMAKSSLKTEGTAVLKSGILVSLYGHFVNHLLEEPVNRGQEGVLFMAGYFVAKEGKAITDEIKARQKHEVYTPLKFDKSTKIPKRFLKTAGNVAKYLWREKVTNFWASAWENKKEISGAFWHNKGKYILSTGSYIATSLAVNFILNQTGIAGPDAMGLLSDRQHLVNTLNNPLVLTAFNTAVSGVMSGLGLRTGAESIMNNLFYGKKKLDAGIETVSGINQKQKPIGMASAQRQAPRLASFVGKIGRGLDSVTNKIKPIKEFKRKSVEIATGRSEKLAILQSFIENRGNPQANFSQEDLSKVIDYLHWMKEEESLLLIHNRRFYEKRKIHTADGKDIYVDNIEGMKKIDETREEVIRYAQNNLPHSQSKKIQKLCMVFDTNLNNIRRKVWKRRLGYTGSSLGYRVLFMGLSSAFMRPAEPSSLPNDPTQPAVEHTNLVHQALNIAFGSDSKIKYPGQQIIAQISAPPTEIFHGAGTSTVDKATEVASRVSQLNLLIEEINAQKAAIVSSPISANHLDYNGLTETQITAFTDSLKAHNMNASDLQSVIYALSSYEEGRQYLATVAASLDGSDHKSLAPLVDYFIKNNPYDFMEGAVKDHHLGPLILLQYPDLAQKLQIANPTLADQLAFLPLRPDEVNNILHQPVDAFTFVKDGQTHTMVTVGNYLTEFVAGLPQERQLWTLSFIKQLGGVMSGDSTSFHEAVSNHSYASFLADSNHLATTNLNENSINGLNTDSIIYKIYHDLNPVDAASKNQIIDLLNRADHGDTKAFNTLYTLVNDKDSTKVMEVFDTKENTDFYALLFKDLPADNNQAQELIKERIKEHMIVYLGVSPVGGPVLSTESMTALSIDPNLLIDPRLALSYALNHKVADLNILMAVQGKPSQIFIQNGSMVGEYHSNFQTTTEISSEDLKILGYIEGQESENNQWVLAKMIKRNFLYLIGRGTESGVSTPATSLVEMMTGGPGQNPLNPDAMSVLHNYDKYGPDYLAKLIIAQYRGHIPTEMMDQMKPNANLVEAISKKNPSIIDQLCYKFESLIAAKQLVENYGSVDVDKAFLNNVDLGTINGVKIRGVEAASQVLFGQPFESLSEAKKFVIIGIGQSPSSYLFDIKYVLDANGKHVLDNQGNWAYTVTENPTKAIDHALYLVNGQIGDKMAVDEKAAVLTELNGMKQNSDVDWHRVFTGGMQLPSSVHNFANTALATRFQGMSITQLNEEVKNGNIQGYQLIGNQVVIELKPEAYSGSTKIMPSDVIFPETINSQQDYQVKLSSTFAGLFDHATRDGDYFKTTTPQGEAYFPAWSTEGGHAVPGIAAVVYDGNPDHLAIADPAGIAIGPQLFGSGFKPLVALFATYKHPEFMNGDPNIPATQYNFNFAPRFYNGIFVQNSATITDNAGPHSIKYILSASGNVGMADLWTTMNQKDPNTWIEFQDFAKNQFGIYFYELKDGHFVPLDHAPSVDVAYGNIYVGGEKASASGMVQMAEFYQKLGEISYIGNSSDPKLIAAAKYVTGALTTPSLKKEIPIWDQQSLDNLNPQCGPGGQMICGFKTGTQQGFDAITGERIAIRTGANGFIFDPATGTVKSVIVLASGVDQKGHDVPQGWGSTTALPAARMIIDSLDSHTSPQTATEMLNNIFHDPNTGTTYSLGTVSASSFIDFVKSQNGGELNPQLREAIRLGQTNNFFVDLVGPSHDGVQTVAIHTLTSGKDSLVTVDIPANMIHPIDADISNIFDHSDQSIIFTLLQQAQAHDPEKYGGILNELQQGGVNFVSLHNYEMSPALFALHEQMVKNHYIFMGGEEAGSVMRQLGLDPNKTVFVNDEAFKSYLKWDVNINTPDHLDTSLTNTSQILVDQLVSQREYLELNQIFTAAGMGTDFDQFLFKNDASNSTYQLLKLFIDTKNVNLFAPTSEEQKFLVTKFQELLGSSDAPQKAPDVIAAYKDFILLSDQIERGGTPDTSLSRELMLGLGRYQKTTDPDTLFSLGLNNKPTAAINFTPTSLVNFASPIETAVVTADPLDILQTFIKHPEVFSLMTTDEKARAALVVNDALMLTGMVESPEAKGLSGQDLVNYMTAHLPANFANDKYVQLYLTQFSYGGRQCGDMNLLINRMLVITDPQHFHDMGGIGGGSAKDFIGDLIQHHNQNPNSPDANILHADGFLKELFSPNEISALKPGDSLIVSFPWLDSSKNGDVGHVVKVLLTGVENGKPYALIFESNADNHGTTDIKKIYDLNELVPEKVWAARDLMYPNPAIATPPEPIFGIVRYEGSN